MDSHPCSLHAPLSTINIPTHHEGAILAIQKPRLWTSFDVVKKLRHTLRCKKIGHAGTLDPLATGLLLICTERKTKTIPYYQNLEKVYTGEMVLGKTTPSIDLETPFDSETSYTHITAARIRQLATSFIGDILQIPPAYSAIKIQGQRAYKKVRQGQPIILPARRVFIRIFEITTIKLPYVQFQVTCGKGTYIRSLVHDFGKQLGVGAYLSALCRTHIGNFSLEDAHDVTTLHTTMKA